jgi:hypothetical protein
MSNKEPKKIQKLLQKLINSESHSFPPHRQPLDAPTDLGVYIIYDPQGRVVHVGRSVSGQEGLHQRLKNHLQGASSFANKYLDGDGSKLRNGYKFKYLAIHDDRKRALVEDLATGTLCPLHLGLGKTKQ